MTDPRCFGCYWYKDECEGTDLSESENDDELKCFKPNEELVLDLPDLRDL